MRFAARRTGMVAVLPGIPMPTGTCSCDSSVEAAEDGGAGGAGPSSPRRSTGSAAAPHGSAAWPRGRRHAGAGASPPLSLLLASPSRPPRAASPCRAR